MRGILKFILLSLIVSITVILPKNNVNADEIRDGISNNSIKFLAYNYPWDFKTQWIEFKFVPQGNGTAKLKYYSDGKILNPSDINPNLTLYYDTYLRLGNIYGYDGGCKFKRGQYMYNVAEILENLTFTYGVDNFQIITHELLLPPTPMNVRFGHNEGIIGAKIEGTVHSNLGNRDFNDDLRFSGTRELYQFRIEKDGLYAQYKNQVKIPDGEYIIETAENINRVVATDRGMVRTQDYVGLNNQKFIFEYDNKRQAYKIKGNNGVLSLVGEDVKFFNDIEANHQFWYIENVQYGKYRLINASDVVKRLNLDDDNSNISIARNSNNFKQEFNIVKPNEKVSITDGEWKIVSKLNNKKVLNVHIGGSDPRNVTIWDDANVVQQKWKFEYDTSRNAFRIKSSYNNGSLAWNSPAGNNVHALGVGDTSNQYWILEYIGDGYYIFKNCRDLNMALDLYKSDTKNASNIQINRKHGGKNQMFKLVR
ncbi:TPA: ricin-type beta-trefoil lectin domain protein [Clostridium perfringens]|nr:ricin-type beta-trefoil lectin domain protein [Clostridium perfringens]